MDFQKVQELAKTYTVIPIYKEVYSDLTTPVSILRKLEGLSSRCFLLESVEEGRNWGRYSFLGYEPVMRVCCKGNIVRIHQNGRYVERKTDMPMDVLREILSEYKTPKLVDMPPFTGGFVGYFAYSMLRYKEPKRKMQEGEFNDFDLMLFHKIIVFDHLRQKIFLIANIRRDRLEENFKQATADLAFIENLIHTPMHPAKSSRREQAGFTCNVSEQEYCRLVERAREYIREGDIFQAVISRKFSAPMQGSLVNAYRILRTTNPSPYMVYLKTDEVELMCSSPETLVKLRGDRLITFPIAGSMPRGKTKEEDVLLEKELLADEKELSEHNMLVDLGRNDLGMISKFDSVKVTQYMKIHRYSKIMHICSQVESTICPCFDAFHAIEAVLPAGTLSGAPKIRACGIIEELEAEPRGIYGGALGYIDFSGDMDTCIAIRMAVKKGNTVNIQAGGGIVADSIPKREYEESGSKAAAVINAVLRAEEVEEYDPFYR